MTRRQRKRTARRRQLVRFLSQSLVLEESGPPRLIVQTIAAISFLVIGLLIWAGVAEIGEVAVADGQIIPAGSVRLVQHLEGGIIAEIFVDEGDVVEAGQSLVRLEAAAALAELEQLRARHAALLLQAERLRAFVDGREPDFSRFGVAHPELQADQEAILAMQREAAVNRRQVLETRVEQRRAELATLEEQRGFLGDQVAIIQEQVDVRRQLLEKGLASRLSFLDTERALSRAQGELAETIGNIARAIERLNEAESSLAELHANDRSDALAEMGEVTAEIAEVREALVRLEDRVLRLEIIAPARGVVQALATRTVGGVVAPGQILMEIVPFDDTLVAEVRLAPRDIGHVRVGHKTMVKVTAYDPARFGSIPGRIIHISPSTLLTETGEPYYKGIIELERNSLGGEPGTNLVLPGMIVNADISTGSRSLLQYLGA
ncbi:MAG: HlyD family type I secretion periplasmic adaptor subunit, partial [Alphaproteobacteria bacterium]